MNKTTKIKIAIKGAGLSYESEIDENMAGHIMALCLSSQEDISAKKAGMQVSAKSADTQRESAAEYLNRHAPKRNPDKILTLAGYLKEFHNKGSFQPSEIKSLFRDAGEIAPANLIRDFKWAISNGWIGPDTAKKGNFFITNTGINVLREGFPEELIKKTKGKFSGRKKSKENHG